MIYVYWVIVIFSSLGLIASVVALILFEKEKKKKPTNYLDVNSEEIKKIKYSIFKK